ncbi:unnamed protein product [Rotaria sordida]|uniref:Uncharacterized protein n=1 Tax=Rotaria sordida TaxID=392033 RepID=A0A814JSW9_9BILA|nr:unnamed protein product [Rotaria sordida]
MANLKTTDKEDEYVLPLSYQSNLVNFIIRLTATNEVVNNQYYTSPYAHCNFSTSLSSSKQTDDGENETNNYINEFQKYQWSKYGCTMPKNWIDPFETYD